jgi:hypothetical protein
LKLVLLLFCSVQLMLCLASFGSCNSTKLQLNDYLSRFSRSTCKQVVELHPGISIDQQAVQQYAAQLDAAAVRAAGAKGNAFPINFESLEAEVRGINILCVTKCVKLKILQFKVGGNCLHVTAKVCILLELSCTFQMLSLKYCLVTFSCATGHLPVPVPPTGLWQRLRAAAAGQQQEGRR